MNIFSFHLAKTSFLTTLRKLWWPPTAQKVAGLKHAECMTRMTLGAAIVSPSRVRFNDFVMFASWENEETLEEFLASTQLGRKLAAGWHVRLNFLRRWGHVSALDGLPALAEHYDPSGSVRTQPVVAVTLARMKLFQVPRFISWGRPVERLVRDHPGQTLALAAIRLPNTVSTFSIWKSTAEMTDMVHGLSAVPQPERHRVAMVERERKDFHYEFTTLRFHALSEHGEWEGQKKFVPQLPTARSRKADGSGQTRGSKT